MNPAQLLATLGAKGVTAVGGESKYERYLPLLDANGQIPAEAVPGGSQALTATIYVDPNGLDTNVGSAVSPVQTLEGAANLAEDTTSLVLYLSPGTYAAPTNPPTLPSTLQKLSIIGAGEHLVNVTGTLKVNSDDAVGDNLEVFLSGVTLATFTDISTVTGKVLTVYVANNTVITGTLSADRTDGGTVHQYPGSTVSAVTNLTQTFVPEADSVSFTPTTSADWVGTPDTVAEGLDELAERTTDLEEAGYAVGPGAAVNDNVAAFDTTTGKLLKDSGVAVADLVTSATTADGTSWIKSLTSHALLLKGIAVSGAISLSVGTDKLTVGFTPASVAITDLSGTLTVAKGGTGATTLSGLVVGNTTSAFTALKLNLSASVNPAVTDDNTGGYSIGSRWINTSTWEEFVCLSAATNGAIWTSTTALSPGSIANYGIGGYGVWHSAYGSVQRLRNLAAYLPIRIEENDPDRRLDFSIDLYALDAIGTTVGDDLLLIERALDGEVFKTTLTDLISEMDIKTTRTGVYRVVTLIPPMVALPTSNPATLGEDDLSNGHTLPSLSFANDTARYASFTTQLPNWDGSDIRVKFTWCSSTTGTAVFGVSARAAASGDYYDNALSTEELLASSCSVSGKVVTSGTTTAITPSGTPGAGSLLEIRVSRHPENIQETLAGTAKLLLVQVQYLESATEDTVWS